MEGGNLGGRGLRQFSISATSTHCYRWKKNDPLLWLGCWGLDTSTTVLRGRAFGVRLGHEDWALTYGFGILLQGLQGHVQPFFALLTFLPYEDTAFVPSTHENAATSIIYGVEASLHQTCNLSATQPGICQPTELWAIHLYYLWIAQFKLLYYSTSDDDRNEHSECGTAVNKWLRMREQLWNWVTE